MRLKCDNYITKKPPQSIHATQSIETIASIVSAYHYNTPLALSSPYEKLLPTPSRPGFTFQTSGSTGTPKQVHLTKENLTYSALGVNEYLNISPSTSWELKLPLFHVAGVGILIRMLLANGIVTLGEPADIISLVPTQLPNPTPTIIVGGAPLPNHLKSPQIIESYGMTEMASTITLNGDLLKYRKLKIDDESRIHVAGEVLTPDCPTPYYATQDKGTLTDKLTLLGRLDRTIIKGGENIDPTEIEKALLSIPQINRAIVIPLEDPYYGEVPIAFIEPFLKITPNLPKFKYPSAYYPIPKTKNLKPSKSELLASCKTSLTS